MGDKTPAIQFPSHIVDQWARAGLDLPATVAGDHLGRRIGLVIREAAPERVVGTLPVEGNTQPFGLLHGGASAVLAETLGSVGALLHAGPGRPVVGVDLNCTHHRSTRTGLVTGTATPLHRGSTTATYEITILDEQDRRVCSARLTCLLRGAAPDGSGAAG